MLYSGSSCLGNKSEVPVRNLIFNYETKSVRYLEVPRSHKIVSGLQNVKKKPVNGWPLNFIDQVSRTI